MTREDDPIVMPLDVQQRLVAVIRARLPRKSFGYLIAAEGSPMPTDFVLFEDNIRNSDDWKPEFLSYGRYFADHDNAGFVATPEESWRLQKELWARGMTQVGVFHSHLRHPANFSQIDYDMHMGRFEHLWHLIVSMRNPEFALLRIFDVSRAGVRERTMIADAPPAADDRLRTGAAENDAVATARSLLALDDAGRPRCDDTQALYRAVRALVLTENGAAVDELLVRGFLRGSSERYERYVAPGMRGLDGGAFVMGTSPLRARHFYGECPEHVVELSPFAIAACPVTNELFGTFDERRQPLHRDDRRKPVAGVSWFDAAVFAMWMGCRLPTEAQWEFACGARSEGEWCCGDDERLLPRHAWYSENSGDEAQPVGTREPNAFGLFDFHGNVWEWCRDGFDQDYYSRAPLADPVNEAPATSNVCRGGSFRALPEMCRTRFRIHEPSGYWAADLGFRLVRGEPTVPG